MSVTCGVITVWKPTHITATNLSFDTTDCDDPCTVTATVTWTNTGGRTGSFSPNISIDGVPSSALPIETLAGGASVTKSFGISGLTGGTLFTDHTICPIPN